MPVSEKKRKSLDAYNATCDYISIRPKKDKGEQIRQAAKLAGQSLQGYILQACAERMERDGLIVAKPSPDDARAKIICLTQKGQDFMSEILPPHYLRVTKLMERLSEAEQKELIHLLKKMSGRVHA